MGAMGNALIDSVSAVDIFMYIAVIAVFTVLATSVFVVGYRRVVVVVSLPWQRAAACCCALSRLTTLSLTGTVWWNLAKSTS